MLGYLYQARYALYLILDSQQEAELSIESIDDVSFEEDGAPVELLQLKHHISKKPSLTDSSSDLWKTIRVWSAKLKAGELPSPRTLLTIITTAEAPENSVASLLRPDRKRDPREACERLIAVAMDSENAQLRSAFDEFTALSVEEQAHLVESIRVLDASPDISDTAAEIKRIVKHAVRREHLDGLYERLEGWWFDKVVRHLTHRSDELIVQFDVHAKIRDIGDQFRPDALPIDFYDKFPPTQPDPEEDDRIFVRQLRAIAINNRRIGNAIVDYYRAFEQRSKWVREQLVFGEELERYERKLVDEWERYRLALEDELSTDNAGEEELQRFGRNVYTWMETGSDIRIRPDVNEPYVQRGSYHRLADERQVWWHPKFVERLRELLQE